MLHNSTVPLHMDSETGPSFKTVTELIFPKVYILLFVVKNKSYVLSS